METLIVYGTFFGATESTAKEIASVLGEQGFKVKVADLKQEKIQDISGYDLVVLGSGMRMGNWTDEAERFAKQFQRALSGKKVALFISSLKPIEDKMGKPDHVARIRRVGLEDKISKYNLNPILTGCFGGVIDFNKVGFLMRKAMEMGYKSALVQYGFKETQPGVYDLHDWDEIRSWSKVLAQKAQAKQD